jgi:hypothetical protein
MLAISRTDLPIALEGEGVEVRATEAGELTAGWFSLAKGVDLGPALVGLPGDLCPCPHWGYMLKGSLRMRTATASTAPVRPSTGRRVTPRRRWRTASMSTSRQPGS